MSSITAQQDPLFQQMTSLLEQQNKQAEEVRKREQQAFVTFKETAEKTQATLLNKIAELEKLSQVAALSLQALSDRASRAETKLFFADQMLQERAKASASSWIEPRSLDTLLHPFSKAPELEYQVICNDSCGDPWCDDHARALRGSLKPCQKQIPQHDQYRKDSALYAIQKAYEQSQVVKK